MDVGRGNDRYHLAEIDADALARRAGMSTRTFHRRCQACLRTTPARLLQKLRVEQARTLLSTTLLPLKTVAANCSFDSAARMQRAFLRELGISPSGCRLLVAARNEEAPAAAHSGGLRRPHSRLT